MKKGRGRKAAWDAFVQQTAGIIYAAVQRGLRQWPHTQQDVEDRAQDVYVRLLQDDCRLLKTFDPKRAGLSTWLTLVTRSTVRDYMLKRRVETVSIEVVGSDVRTGSNSSHANSHPPVDLSILTERQRLVLQMVFDEGMTVDQAAARIGVDLLSIRSTKHKALSRLRESMNLGEKGEEKGQLESADSGDEKPVSSLEQ